MIVNRVTLSQCLGLTTGRITQLVHDGVLSREARNQYDLKRCLQQYINFKLQGGQSGTHDVVEARKRLYDAQAHKVNLANERTRREVIPAITYLADLHQLQKIVDKALDGIDGTLAADLARLQDAAAIAERIGECTHAVRETIADEITEYAAGSA
jgi:phage terminase Nu1 subunit (DNA packaging protein)